MKDENKSKIILILSVFIFFVIGYCVGYNESVYHIEEKSVFDFNCNPYHGDFYDCDKGKKFENITGLYCNGRLVCQNHLKGDLNDV